MNNENRYQFRKTKEDVRSAQEKLRVYIKSNMRNNTPLSDKQRDEWYGLCSDALFAFGCRKKVSVNLPGVTIPMGSVHSFALRFLDWDESTVVLKHHGQKCTFQIRFLWRLLHEMTIEVFPLSLDEAWHISKESFEPNQHSSYNFSAKKNLQSG